MTKELKQVMYEQETRLQELYAMAYKNRLMSGNSIYLYEYIEFLAEDILQHFQYNIVTGEQPAKEIHVVFSEDGEWKRTTELTAIRHIEQLNSFETEYFEKLVSVYATVSKTDFNSVWVLRFKD